MKYKIIEEKEKYTNKIITILKIKSPFNLHQVILLNYNADNNNLMVVDINNNRKVYNLQELVPQFIKVKNQKTKLTKMVLVNDLKEKTEYNQYSFSIEIFE